MTDGLREYQINAIHELRSAIRDGHKRVMLYSPTGSGKTEIGISIIRSAAAKEKCVGFVCNRISLVNQASKRFAKSKIPHGIIQGQNSCYTHSNVLVCSIKTLEKRGYPPFDLLVIDEAHGCTAQEYVKLLQTYNNIPVIGLSATPFTHGLGQQHEWGKLFDTLVCATTIRELIDLGFLVDCDIYAPSEPDLKGVKIVRGDYDEKQLGIAVDKAPLIGDIIEHWKKLAFGLQTVVFATNIAHSKHIVESFISAGITAEHIDCYSTDEERAAIFDRYNLGITKVISNVSVLAEGWDQPSVACMILARPTRSLTRWIQMCLDSETEILTRNGWKKYNTILYNDEVAAFDLKTNTIDFEIPKQIISRHIESEENMFEILSPHIDLRITGGHDIVWSSRKNAMLGIWKKDTAQILFNHKSNYAIPISGNGNFPGVNLTDDEIRFLGLWITDGTTNKQNKQVVIYQSTAQPESHHKYIRNVLEGCGFRYGITTIKRKGNLSQYADMLHYKISYGNPINALERKYLRGWNLLEKYMDKNISSALDEMDERQFSIYLEAINMGDGRKFRCIKTWTPKTLSITTGNNIKMADKLQAMCIVRGYRCNISVHHYNKSPLYVAAISKKSYACIGGLNAENGRSSLRPSPSIEKEIVWCVTTNSGNIVVRRHGKAAIVGNCGRALRPFSGKEKAIILDHSGTCHRLGYPTDDLPLELNDGRKSESEKTDKPVTEKLPRKCPHCHFMIPAGTGLCPKCGTKLQKQDKTKHEDGDLKKVDRKPVYTHDQKQMLWSESLGLMEQRKKSVGWASHLYKSLTGVWPTGLNDHPSIPSAAVINMATHNAIAFARSKKRQPT